MDLIDQTWIGQRFVGRLVTASSGGRVHDIHASCEALAMIGSQLKEHGIVKEAGVFRYLQISSDIFRYLQISSDMVFPLFFH